MATAAANNRKLMALSRCNYRAIAKNEAFIHMEEKLQRHSRLAQLLPSHEAYGACDDA